MNDQTDIHELVYQYFDGMAGEADLAALEHRLATDVEAADVFVRISYFNVLLEDHFTDRDSQDRLENLLNQLAEISDVPSLPKPPAATTPRSPMLGFLGDVIHDIRHHPTRFWPFVSVIFVLVLLGSFGYSRWHGAEADGERGFVSVTELCGYGEEVDE